jgi:hypothetical protein
VIGLCPGGDVAPHGPPRARPANLGRRPLRRWCACSGSGPVRDACRAPWGPSPVPSWRRCGAIVDRRTPGRANAAAGFVLRSNAGRCHSRRVQFGDSWWPVRIPLRAAGPADRSLPSPLELGWRRSGQVASSAPPWRLGTARATRCQRRAGARAPGAEHGAIAEARAGVTEERARRWSLEVRGGVSEPGHPAQRGMAGRVRDPHGSRSVRSARGEGMVPPRRGWRRAEPPRATTRRPVRRTSHTRASAPTTKRHETALDLRRG